MAENPSDHGLKLPRRNFLVKALSFLALKAAGVSSASYRASDAEFVRWFGNVSKSGRAVTEDAAMGLSAVWSCIRILSETLGALPWALYKRDKSGNAAKTEDHPLHDVLIRSPNEDMTSTEFRESMVLNLCQRGNAYARIQRSGGEIMSLYPLRASRVRPRRGKSGEVYYEVLEDGGVTRRVERSDIWHVKGFGADGLEGLSPLAAARETMGFALATEDYGSAFFAQGGAPAGVVSIPQTLVADQAELAREKLNRLLGGLGNAHRFALLDGGMKLEPWGGMPLEDMQFILLRRFSVQEICRFYRVPPHMVADLERATFSNIEHMSQEFVQFTLMPYFTRFEASAAKWLLSAEDVAKGYFLRFNFEGLLRADSAGRATLYSQALQNGWMSRNEVRAKENLNNVEGLDVYTVQTNLAPVGAIEDMADAQIAATRRPAAAIAAPVPDAMPAAAANDAGDKMTEQPQINIQLPEIVRKDMKYSLDHPGIREVVERSKAAEKRLDDRISSLEAATQSAVGALDASTKSLQHATEAAIAALAASTAKSIEQVARVALMPRQPIYHSDGEIAGAIPVEKLDLH